MSDFEQDMTNDFVEEANELLASIEEDFLILEKQKDNPDIELINKLFRAVHTIKGTSGFLGLKNIGKVSHIMETVMSKIRDGKLKPESNYIDALLSGADLLKKMTANILESNDTNIEQVYERLNLIINEIENANPSISNTEPQDNQSNNIDERNSKDSINDNPNIDNIEIKGQNFDNKLANEFVLDAKKIISSVEKDIKTLKTQLSNPSISLINKVYRAIDTFKSTSELLNLQNLLKTTELINILLLQIRNHQIIPEEQHIEIILQAIDKINTMLDDISFSNDMDLNEFINDFTKIINNKKAYNKPIIQNDKALQEKEFIQAEDIIENNINAV